MKAVIYARYSSDNQREDAGRNANPQRIPRSVNNTGEYVPSQFIGSEPVLPAGSLQTIGRILCNGLFIRNNNIGKDCDG